MRRILLGVVLFCAIPALCQSDFEKCQQGACYGYHPPTGISQNSMVYRDLSTTPPTLYCGQAGGWGICSGGGGSGSVSGQASGVIPLATGATAIGAQSHLSDDGTNINASLPVKVLSAGSSGLVSVGPLSACGNQGANPGPVYSYWDGFNARIGSYCASTYLEHNPTGAVHVRPNSGTNGQLYVETISGSDSIDLLSQSGNQLIASTGLFTIQSGSGNALLLGASGSTTNRVHWDGTMWTVGLKSIGTQTISGCSLTTAVGGGTAGSFHSGTAGTCTVTITPGFTASNGFSCFANDLTTTTDHLYQTASTTTTATIAGTTASGDVVTWGCISY